MAQTATATPPATYGDVVALGETLGLRPRQLSTYLGVSTRTLDRRRKEGALREGEALRLQMLGQIVSLALQVFGGDRERVRTWLFDRLPVLGNVRPVDSLVDLAGYERIRRLLGQIAFGAVG